MHTTTEIAILGLVAWALFIAFTLVGERSFRVLFYGHKANGFHPHGEGLSGFRQRLVRVHANNYENLALLIALPLFALATGKSTVTDGMALWLLAARVAQGVTHISSTTVLAVYVRVTFYSVQLLIVAAWGVALWN